MFSENLSLTATEENLLRETIDIFLQQAKIPIISTAGFADEFRAYGGDKRPKFDIDYHNIDSKMFLHKHLYKDGESFVSDLINAKIFPDGKSIVESEADIDVEFFYVMAFLGCSFCSYTIRYHGDPEGKYPVEHVFCTLGDTNGAVHKWQVNHRCSGRS